MRYADLIHPDGTRNVEAFCAILNAHYQEQVNLALCSVARLCCPRSVSFGHGTARWRAAAAARLDPDLITDDERTRILMDEGARLEEWVAAMQREHVRRHEAPAPANSNQHLLIAAE